MESINIDLIYGLLRHSPKSFDRTLAPVAEFRPNRIALYAYAHLLQARLHRNFQDHNTQLDCDLIALGDLSIGRIGATYSQNPKTLEPYDDSLDQSRFPVVRGLALSRDDLIRCTVIEALMCQGQVSFESIELACLIDIKVCFGTELIALQALARQGLVLVDDTRIQIASTGWFFVRAVAMVFDRYLQTDRTNARFSKII